MADPSNYVVTVNDGVTALNLPGVSGDLAAGDIVEMSPRQFQQMTPAQVAAVTITQSPAGGLSQEQVDDLATDAEVAAAIADIPVPDLSSKQDAATAATDAELAAAQAGDDARLDTLEAAPAGEASPFTDTGTIISSDDTQASWVVGSDRMDRDAADATKDIRSFFNKAKGAFRAGRATAAQWDDASVGFYSSAVGSGTVASGQNSSAEGSNTTASGTNSHAEGSSNTASGSSSHVEGVNSLASGTASHAEGNATTASGTNAHAEGSATYAYAPQSHAEGNDTVVSSSATAGHTEGYGTRVEGAYGHAQGYYAKARRVAESAQASGFFATHGDGQVANMVLMQSTTDATPTVLRTNKSATDTLTGAGINVLTLTASRSLKVKIDVVARRTDVAGEAAGWTFEGVIARDATGSARIVGAMTAAAWGDAAAGEWDVTPSINTTDATNNYLAVTVTGEAGKTIRWVASINWVEVG